MKHVRKSIISVILIVSFVVPVFCIPASAEIVYSSDRYRMLLYKVESEIAVYKACETRKPILLFDRILVSTQALGVGYEDNRYLTYVTDDTDHVIIEEEKLLSNLDRYLKSLQNIILSQEGQAIYNELENQIASFTKWRLSIENLSDYRETLPWHLLQEKVDAAGITYFLGDLAPTDTIKNPESGKKSTTNTSTTKNSSTATTSTKPTTVSVTPSTTSVTRGKKTTVKITSDAGAKMTVKAKSKNAKNKKNVTIKNGKVAKLIFGKKAAKGTYKFIVICPKKGKFKKTTKTVTIKVK